VLKAFRGGYTEVPEKKFLWDDSLRKYDEAINELIRPDQ